MAAAKPEQEPSMEEILASIRRIIAEEGSDAPAEQAANAAQDDVLELTQVVDEAPAAPAPADDTPADDPPPAAPAPAPEPAMAADDTPRLVTGNTASAAASKFSSLARAAEPDPLMGVRGGRTVEQLCVELLRPMLKEWLDANLPGIVERLVEREIRYLSRRPENE
jgi:cell pole-organizing protein PopZ